MMGACCFLLQLLWLCRDTKLFVYGGDGGNSGGSSKKGTKGIGHSIEIDLVPSWAHKHRKGRKQVQKQSMGGKNKHKHKRKKKMPKPPAMNGGGTTVETKN